MPHWLQATLGVAGALASWRFVLRPVRKGYRRLIALLEAIRDASGGVQKLTHEVRALAGAVVQLCVGLVAQQAELEREVHELRGQTRDLATLYVEVQADVERLRKSKKG